MNLPYWALALPVNQPHLRPHSRRIARTAFQPHAQTRLRPYVVKQLRRIAVLRHDQIHAPVAIVVSQGAAALLAVNRHAAFLARHRLQPALTITSEPQGATSVLTPLFRKRGKKILAQENIFLAIPIHVPDTYAKSRRELGFHRQ